jgi:hypothetical protein
VVFPNGSGQRPQITGSPKIAEGPSLGTNGGVLWNGLSWPNDQTSEVTIQSLASASAGAGSLSLFVRVNAAGTTGYYLNAISSGTIIVIDYGTGLITYLTITGLTFTAGDVITFQAAGSVMTVYQNGKPLGFFADATFTSGSPGFAVDATGTLANCQVASWRGYNAVQQDGVWQKQGIVLAPNATDLASSGQGLFGGSFIYDSNPQLISGGHCYKTWFSGGTPGSQGTYYAESPDLITWTRKAAQVISGYTGAQVIKVGSTYYSYSQLQNQAGSGTIALHTSSDGITFTLISSNVLAAGGVGTWDHTQFYPLRPITVISGTWYALTTGDQGNGQFAIGLATSTDGAGAVWTKYVSNPVLTATGSSVYPFSNAWALVSGTYYFWHNVGPSAPQQASGQDIYFLPSEAARYSTTDFIHWTGPVHSIHHSDQYEDVNGPTGATPNNPGSGLGPCAIFTVGKKTYAIGQAEVIDGATAGTQFALAIAPAPVSSLVTQPEDAVQQVATDAFTSGAGDLSANWTLPTGGTKLKIVAGPYVEPTVLSTVCQAVYTGATFGTSQYSEVTIHALTGTLAQSLIWPTVLSSTTALTNYEGRVVSPAGTQGYTAAIYKRVAGTPTQIGPTLGCTPTVGDVWRLSVILGGSDGFPVLSLYQNGSLIVQVQDQSATPLTTGNPGIQAYSIPAIADAQIASWAGGNANVTPNYPPNNPQRSSLSK